MFLNSDIEKESMGAHGTPDTQKTSANEVDDVSLSTEVIHSDSSIFDAEHNAIEVEDRYLADEIIPTSTDTITVRFAEQSTSSDSVASNRFHPSPQTIEYLVHCEEQSSTANGRIFESVEHSTPTDNRLLFVGYIIPSAGSACLQTGKDLTSADDTHVDAENSPQLTDSACQLSDEAVQSTDDKALSVEKRPSSIRGSRLPKRYRASSTGGNCLREKTHQKSAKRKIKLQNDDVSSIEIREYSFDFDALVLAADYPHRRYYGVKRAKTYHCKKWIAWSKNNKFGFLTCLFYVLFVGEYVTKAI